MLPASVHTAGPGPVYRIGRTRTLPTDASVTVTFKGCGAEQDYGEADRWFRRAEQGDVYAQYILGVTHENGHDVGRDGVEAARWYSLAAEQRDPDARTAPRPVSDDLGGWQNARSASESDIGTLR